MSIEVGTNLTSPPKQIGKKQVIMALFASTAGWSLDLFDLFLLLYVAPTIGPLFFPSTNHTLSLAGVYGAFAISCIVRPFAAVIFGAYADKHGRKKALFITMGGVGLTTTAMGLLPTVPQIGVSAAVLFLFMRLLQGLFVGGVTASTHTIGTETVPPSWRGWVSGVVTGAGGGVGALLASVVFWIVSTVFPGPSFEVWGWRCMFYSGLFSALFALFIFKYLNESPLFLEQQKNKKTDAPTPIKVLFSVKYRYIAFTNMLVVLGAASIYYLTSGYMPTFLAVVNNLPKPEAAKLLMWGGVIGIIAPIIVGQLSEMYGRRKAFIGSGLACLLVFGLFGYLQMVGLHEPNAILPYVIVLLFLGNGTYAPCLIYLNERFPTAIRATGTGVCWNVGFAIGGLMPMFVSFVSPTYADIPVRLTWFLFAVTVVMLLAILSSPETKGHFE